MVTGFKPLELHPLAGTTSYFQPEQDLSAKVSMDSPAVLVMTDLRQVTAITVEPSVSVDWALSRMKERGVRLLLVTNASDQVVGLITANDIQGEKPMRFVNQAGRRHEEIMVRDVMAPVAGLEVVMMEQVLKGSVGDVVATLRRLGRQHVLVLDEDRRTGRPSIRGIFSITQIGKQLGEKLEDIYEVANTFAEMQVALNP